MRDRIDLRDQDRHPPSRLRERGESIQNACRRIDPRGPSPTDRTPTPPRYDSATFARAPVRSFWAGLPRQSTVAGLIRAMSRPERAFRFARKHDQRCVRSTAAIHDLRKASTHVSCGFRCAALAFAAAQAPEISAVHATRIASADLGAGDEGVVFPACRCQHRASDVAVAHAPGFRSALARA